MWEWALLALAATVLLWIAAVAVLVAGGSLAVVMRLAFGRPTGASKWAV